MRQERRGVPPGGFPRPASCETARGMVKWTSMREGGVSVDELKLVVASNLIRLRQKAGMTQAELGEKLNYSDKTVSKWERGESVPDAYSLTRLAEIYGLTVDDLLHSETEWRDPVEKARAEERAAAPTFSSNMVTLVAIVGIWTMAVIMFVVFWLLVGRVEWLIFACAVPVSLVTLLVLNSVWNKGRHNMLIVMLLVAAVVTLLFLFLMRYKPWQLFLILIPAEILVVLCFHIRRRKG